MTAGSEPRRTRLPRPSVRLHLPQRPRSRRPPRHPAPGTRARHTSGRPSHTAGSLGRKRAAEFSVPALEIHVCSPSSCQKPFAVSRRSRCSSTNQQTRSSGCSEHFPAAPRPHRAWATFTAPGASPRPASSLRQLCAQVSGAGWGVRSLGHSSSAPRSPAPVSSGAEGAKGGTGKLAEVRAAGGGSDGTCPHPIPGLPPITPAPPRGAETCASDAATRRCGSGLSHKRACRRGPRPPGPVQVPLLHISGSSHSKDTHPPAPRPFLRFPISPWTTHRGRDGSTPASACRAAPQRWTSAPVC